MRTPWYTLPLAILVVAAMVATTVIVLTQPVGPQTVTSAISLNFGSDPVTDELNVTYARVSFLSQPTEWNTTGFINGTLGAGGTGAWWYNSTDYGTHYGISQWNGTPGTYHWATVDYKVSSYLGTNVSYIFTDQRFAMNGTSDDFEAGIGESALAGAGQGTSGSVAVGSTSATQNAIWIDAMIPPTNPGTRIRSHSQPSPIASRKATTSIPRSGVSAVNDAAQ